MNTTAENLRLWSAALLSFSKFESPFTPSHVRGLEFKSDPHREHTYSVKARPNLRAGFNYKSSRLPVMKCGEALSCTSILL
jgi:hypothetical protein